MASGTGLLRLDDCDWDGELLAALDIDPTSLPPVAAVDQGLMGRYRSALAALADIPWLHAAGDGALANLGTGCVSAKSRSVTIGTSGALRAMHGPTSSRVPNGLWRYRLDTTRLVTGGALSNGGNLVDWCLRTLRITRARLADHLRETGRGTDGLTFLPHLAGERSLGYATGSTGAIAQLTSATTPEDIATAALEAVAVNLANIDRALDEAVPGAQRLVASGSALLSLPEWMQMIADASGRPVVQPRVTEASSRGAALFAMEQLGFDQPEPDAGGALRVFEPVRNGGAIYRAIDERQGRLYKALVTDHLLDRSE